MTTVAFDGKTLAADTLACWGTTPSYRTKIWRTPKNKRWKAIGIAGNTYNVLPVADFICGRTTKKPKQFENDGMIMLVDKQNKLWMMDGQQVPVEAPMRFAMGSGGDFALGAMAAGKTAAEAVAIAATLDVNTGGKVDEISMC